MEILLKVISNSIALLSTYIYCNSVHSPNPIFVFATCYFIFVINYLGTATLYKSCVKCYVLKEVNIIPYYYFFKLL